MMTTSGNYLPHSAIHWQAPADTGTGANINLIQKPDNTMMKKKGLSH